MDQGILVVTGYLDLVDLHSTFDVSTGMFANKDHAEGVALRLMRTMEGIFVGKPLAVVEGSKKQYHVTLPAARDFWWPKSTDKRSLAEEMLRVAGEFSQMYEARQKR